MTTPGTTPLTESWTGTGRGRFWLGAKSAWPVVMGYGPIGFALGVLAVQSGLTPAEIGAMSLFVYAGASQFIGVGMLAADAGMAAITATTFLVNVRHLLMSAALSPYFHGVRRPILAFLSFFVTDESFAVSSTVFAERKHGDATYFAGLGLTAYVAWFVATMTGALVGGVFDIPVWLGLDFALTGMFIGLLAGTLRSRPAVASAIVAGVMAVATAQSLGRWSVMAAAVSAATAGVVMGRWTHKSS